MAVAVSLISIGFAAARPSVKVDVDLGSQSPAVIPASTDIDGRSDEKHSDPEEESAVEDHVLEEGSSLKIRKLVNKLIHAMSLKYIGDLYSSSTLQPVPKEGSFDRMSN